MAKSRFDKEDVGRYKIRAEKWMKAFMCRTVSKGTNEKAISNNTADS